MTFGPLWFTVVPHEDRAFSHHLEVGPFSSDFILYYDPGPFLRTNEELGRSREVLDLFKSKVVLFTCSILQVQDNDA